MHGNRAVAQHGFRTGCGDGDVIAGFAQCLVTVFVFFDVFIGRTTRERVFEMPHVAVDFDIFDLKIGNRCLKMRVPIHEALATVDQPIVVHFHKDLDHGVVEVAFFTFGGVWGTGHGKCIAGPVT